MSGQVCKEIKNSSGTVIGFEVVAHFVDGVDVMANQTQKKKDSSKSNKEDE